MINVLQTVLATNRKIFDAMEVKAKPLATPLRIATIIDKHPHKAKSMIS
jgi:hypothetical protein